MTRMTTDDTDGTLIPCPSVLIRVHHLREDPPQAGERAAGALLDVIAWVFVLDRDHLVVAGLAYGTEQSGPRRIVPTLADRRKMPGRQCGLARRGEMQHAVAADALGVEQRVLAVHPADAVTQLL